MSFVGAVPFARTRFDLRTATLTRPHGRLGAGLGHDPRVAREGAPETAARGARRADAGRHRHHPGGGAHRGGKALLAAVTPRVRLPRAIRAAYKGRCSRSALSRVLTPNP